jgi:hypothetical protein
MNIGLGVVGIAVPSHGSAIEIGERGAWRLPF